jgi:ubiquinone/menaquinone biosynthesis C-methylase UbiE
MNVSLKDSYKDYYSNELTSKLWPTEFAVRALLGRNYQFDSPSNLDTALDLGFGDGRNIPLLNSIYKNTHGLEIDDKICKLASEKFPQSEFYVGASNNISKPEEFYDLVLAVHSLYYCLDNNISTHFQEIYRVLKVTGRLVFSIPTEKSYLVRNSQILENEYARIKNDPLGIRNSTIVKYFSCSDRLREFLLSFGYKNIRIGLSDNDWWGIRESYWTVSAFK